MSIDLSSLESLGLTTTSSSSSSSTTTDLDQDAFLELMMTQLNNQDPLNPMESSDFLGQIAQISTVTGIQDLQDSFSTLSDSLTSDQSLQAANLVGHTVLVESSEGLLSAGGTLDGEITLDSDAAVSLGIYDTSGELVATLDLGDQSEGQVSFSWNGTLDDGSYADPGTYVLAATATDSDGVSSSAATQVQADVESVTLGDSMSVSLSGLGTVSFDDVQKIL